MEVTQYPKTTQLTLDLQDLLYKMFYHLTTGISEFTFAGLYLFRNKYKYSFSETPDHKLLIFGEEYGSPFCMFPFGFPDEEILDDILKKYHYFKAVSEMDIKKTEYSLNRKDFISLKTEITLTTSTKGITWLILREGNFIKEKSCKCFYQ